MAQLPPCLFKITELEEPFLVKPAMPKEDHLYYISNLDQINMGVIVKTIYIYDTINNPITDEDLVRVLKDSLSKVLVHYYPLAGRIAINPSDGKLIVNANGEGVLFVEAECKGYKVSDLGDLSMPDPERLGQLVYEVPGAETILQIPLLIVQVTKFGCGGFVLGLSVNHCMFDGIAAMEFVNSWAETARGLPLSNPPNLDRTILKPRTPPQINFQHNEFFQIKGISLAALNMQTDLVHKSFCFTSEHLERLKKKVILESHGSISKCTSFEALSGLVWRARTEAMGMLPEQKTKLLIVVNCRTRLQPPLPTGYMGNGIILTVALTSAGEINEKPFYNAVKHVQNAIHLVTNDYIRSTIDYFEVKQSPISLTSTILITTWSRFSFHKTDFGWGGEPTYFGPVALPGKEVVLFLSHGKERKSINVLLALPPHAMQKFEEILELHL